MRDFYSLTRETKEVLLRPFSNYMEVLERRDSSPQDFSRPPTNAKPGSYNITKMEIWSGDW
jgi:hypothetical protein